MAQSVYIASICTYELVALSTGWVPTITSVVRRRWHRPLTPATVLAHVAWLIWHLSGDE